MLGSALLLFLQSIYRQKPSGKSLIDQQQKQLFDILLDLSRNLSVTFFRNILEDWKVLAILLLRCKKKKKSLSKDTQKIFLINAYRKKNHCNCKKENAKKQEENILQDSLEARLRCEEFWVSSAGWSL